MLIEPVTVERARATYRRRSEETMTASSLSGLLARLHADPDGAALEYEHLRRALVRFFDWRGAWPADECADEALDRLARKVQQIPVQDVRKYAHGIARLILLERRRQPAFASIDDLAPLTVPAAAPVDGGHQLQDCFERCLAELPEESRSLVLRYYEGERQSRISNRRRLASILGLSENALRSRVQRLRDRLERCVYACAQRAVSDPL